MRHGESVDNTKSLWAGEHFIKQFIQLIEMQGHRDSPLTNHGMQQAKAAGQSLKSTEFDKVYCSDLKRAHWTAQQVILANTAFNVKEGETKEVVNPVMREQFFGDAEGTSWNDSNAYIREGDRRSVSPLILAWYRAELMFKGLIFKW